VHHVESTLGVADCSGEGRKMSVWQMLRAHANESWDAAAARCGVCASSVSSSSAVEQESVGVYGGPFL
jgi:hypothetical protein